MDAGTVSSQLLGQPGRGRIDAGEPGEQRASAARRSRSTRMCWPRRRRARRPHRRARRNSSTWTETAIPILGKQAKPSKKTQPRRSSISRRPNTKCGAIRRAAGSIMPHQMQPGICTGRRRSATTILPACIRGMWTRSTARCRRHWNKGEVDPRTPKGARVYLVFTIHRDGTVSAMQIRPIERKPHVGRFVRARRAARGHIWHAAVKL